MAEAATWVGGPADGRVQSIPNEASSVTMLERFVTKDGTFVTEWDVPVSRRKDRVRIMWAGRTETHGTRQS